jgi:hypothetical protein
MAGEAASPDEVIAGLRMANARLRELPAERDAHIAHLLAQAAQVDELQARKRVATDHDQQHPGKDSQGPDPGGEHLPVVAVRV